MRPDTEKVVVEVCVEGAASARIAAAAGAQRIELCAALDLGGITPSLGTIARVREVFPGTLIVLVRPRAGGFVFSDDELEVQHRDILAARREGADGVAIGCLHADGTIDIERSRRLVDAARPGTVTFHRAFDLAREPFEAIDAVIATGVDRVLTSGHAATAAAGTRLIRELVERAGSGISVMAGAGIGPDNVRALIDGTGVLEVHLSARPMPSAPPTLVTTGVRLGPNSLPGEPDPQPADLGVLLSVIRAIKS